MNKAFIYWDGFLTYLVKGLNMVMAIGQAYLTAERPSLREQSLLFKRLGMLLEAGLPIDESLHILANERSLKQTENSIHKVAAAVGSGTSLSRALAESKYPLNNLSKQIISLGETSGTLIDSLQYVAQLQKERAELRKQVFQAMIYPAIIILATIGISLFLIVGIFPKILPIFLSVNTTLPLSTQVLIFLSDSLKHHWYLMLGVVVLIIVASTFLLQITKVRLGFSRCLLVTPIVGGMVRAYQLTISCRTLGLLLTNNVRIVTALTVVAESASDLLYAQAWRSVVAEVESGQSLSYALRQFPRLFPHLMVQMIEVGERTGNLSHTLLYLAEQSESDVRDGTKNLTTLLEPILMLGMGLVVGFIAISIIAPIYGITEHLHE
jgi:type IV pilus assembly protein PilC